MYWDYLDAVPKHAAERWYSPLVPCFALKPVIFYGKVRLSVLSRAYLYGAYIYRLFRKYIMRRNISVVWISKIIDYYKIVFPDLRPSLDHPIRDLVLMNPNPNHTHPTAAAERSAANELLCSVVTNAGMRPYLYSMSKEDERNGRDGCRFTYWAKDVPQPFRCQRLETDHVIVMTDVDFYVDMPFLLGRRTPILMYTLVPEKAAENGNEFSFHIKDDQVCYVVTGGANYKHGIWNYKGDTLCVLDENKNLVIWHVSQHRILGSPHRRFITLLPSAVVCAPAWRFLPDVNPGLERIKYTNNGVNVVFEPIRGLVSLAMNDSHTEFTMKHRTFDALLHRLQSKTTTALIGDVEVFLYADQYITEHKNKENIKVEASIIHKAMVKLDKDISTTFKATVTDTNTVNTYYQSTTPLVTVDAKDPAMIICSPLVTKPALMPANTINNELAAVQGRIIDPWNLTKPPRQYHSYARDLLQAIVPKPGMGVPWSLEQVMQAQSSPAQRARTDRVQHNVGVMALNKLKTFLKVEAYPKTNHPRIITQMTAETTIEMSRFTYAFSAEVLKPQQWYGPGKSPAELAQKLQNITVTYNGSWGTDFNRCDGSWNSWMGNFIKSIYLRWVNVEDKPLLDHYFTQVYLSKARTRNGLQVPAGPGTRSGSPPTTQINTMAHMALKYFALRNMGHTHKHAWNILASPGGSVFAGDDGLDPAIEGFEQAFRLVAHDFNMKVDVDLYPPGTSVRFLSRVFPNIEGTLTSHQCVKRTLPKLHITGRKTMTVEQAATNRAQGYLVGDSLTPLLGNWCKAVKRITGLDVKNLTTEEHYKIENCAWPQLADDIDLLKDSVARDLGMTTMEIEERMQAIDQVKDLNGFPIVWENPQDHRIQAQLTDGEVTAGQRINYNPQRPRSELKLRVEDGGQQQQQQQQQSSSSSCKATGDSGARPAKQVRAGASRDEVAQHSSKRDNNHGDATAGESRDLPQEGSYHRSSQYKRSGCPARKINRTGNRVKTRKWQHE